MSAWKRKIQSSLKENIEKVGLSANYASIATVKPNNMPAVRTVVMRDFAGEHHADNTGWNSDLLVVITDKRSDKINELKQNPNTELNWYMNGTMEQFRVVGTVDMIEKNYDSKKLEHLDSHFEQVETGEHDHKNLALEMFLKQQKSVTTNKFNWQAERLRHFYQFGTHMRAQMTNDPSKPLDINEIDPKDGWFKNDQLQDSLEEAFENFVLLVITVTSVRHWSPCTGTKSLL
ncbi:hypothetical protein MFLAVUS_001170 [Mucor flavus]|uniref:Pyridoxamine 5'-phosphate oxidase Alr4036 family FMN-binding domain-containing protein n=1 Tax=Mucor flavus TaxID=439312 RepID=A0ABP9YLQ2_9FUNG